MLSCFWKLSAQHTPQTKQSPTEKLELSLKSLNKGKILAVGVTSSCQSTHITKGNWESLYEAAPYNYNQAALSPQLRAPSSAPTSCWALSTYLLSVLLSSLPFSLPVSPALHENREGISYVLHGKGSPESRREVPMKLKWCRFTAAQGTQAPWQCKKAERCSDKYCREIGRVLKKKTKHWSKGFRYDQKQREEQKEQRESFHLKMASSVCLSRSLNLETFLGSLASFNFTEMTFCKRKNTM